MPLDPFFAERLRVHRRYLIGQALDKARDSLGERLPFLRRRAGVPAAVPPSVPSPAVASPVVPSSITDAAVGSGAADPAAPAPAATAPEPAEPASTVARRKHRAAARRWDRKELADVGTRGPKVTVAEHTVPVDGYPDVRVRIYRPHGSEDRILPAAVAFYGGAFRIGGIDYPTTDAANRRRCTDADVAVVAVDYALAPEHKYPTQVEQGYAALAWVAGNARDLHVDPDRLAVQGTSAGGALAAAVTLMARDRRGPALRLQVLEVPVTDLTGRHIDFRATYALGIPAMLAIRELLSVSRTYLPTPADAYDGYASPLRASGHADLPPAVILTAEYDPLRGDGAAYGAALRRAGVDASVVRYQGVNHDVWIFTGVLPAARRWHADVVTALRRLHD